MINMGSLIIGYDITSPKRLQRVYRAMLGHATPIEYSIFLLTGSERDCEKCISQIKVMIDESSDDLRCYPLPANALQQRLGKATLPVGICWSVLPSTL